MPFRFFSNFLFPDAAGPSPEIALFCLYQSRYHSSALKAAIHPFHDASGTALLNAIVADARSNACRLTLLRAYKPGFALVICLSFHIRSAREG
jgi:hypothetical protein